ncbi:MAG TPA: GIY-YIG nuclease family protein [Gemmatimonadaceae bacterium]|nr:GIY-YIG nuclease family protein [Gemmatimonadaceae bacterium]
MRQFFIYILASRSRRLYTGVTSNLQARLWQHRDGQCGFTARYRITRLVYFETTENVMSAIEREKQIKAWRREKRVALIQSVNPTWDDLAESGLPERSAEADPSSLRSSG